jgi:hypothetical protein
VIGGRRVARRLIVERENRGRPIPGGHCLHQRALADLTSAEHDNHPRVIERLEHKRPQVALDHRAADPSREFRQFCKPSVGTSAEYISADPRNTSRRICLPDAGPNPFAALSQDACRIVRVGLDDVVMSERVLDSSDDQQILVLVVSLRVLRDPYWPSTRGTRRSPPGRRERTTRPRSSASGASSRRRSATIASRPSSAAGTGGSSTSCGSIVRAASRVTRGET